MPRFTRVDYKPAALARISGGVARSLRKLGFFLAVLAVFCVPAIGHARDDRFTVAVIPDTQFYVDFTHQRADGFPFDARQLFFEQMRYVADNLESGGGEIAFVTAVGDVWQHQTKLMDPAHAARGFTRIPNARLDATIAPERVPNEEMTAAKAGYELIAGRVPFSVVPGNHDYDASWLNALPQGKTAAPGGSAAAIVHVGGLDNFRTIFGSQSSFFKGKPWYVASHDGGADSAQIFTAAGHRFLHIGLQFDPPNASLDWAASVIRKHPGLPTIISTHDYLSKQGQRVPSPAIDASAADPQDNSPEMVWSKLISRHDQIFMVLCGHQPGQALRIDTNAKGHKVYQLLADYQTRAQTAKDAGLQVTPALGIGDGWMRLMEFDFSGATPVVRVHTYSTHYRKRSTDTPEYAAWYKADEKPQLSDEAFRAEDDFALEPTDFRQRFKYAAHEGSGRKTGSPAVQGRKPSRAPCSSPSP